ncbi:MAG: methyl-accepting chemotaxis protein [Selenomonadaceae bacterium]|nr:methyl-accepting chemotaxis protein [Selenomonadaceae bacterium]
MNLKTKVAMGITALIIITCLCLGGLGYRNATKGFSLSLQEKAASSVMLILEIMDDRYPGSWQVRNGLLYKGDTQIEGSTQAVDFFGSLVGGHITVFRGDTRVATTVKNAEGTRSTGTKASDKVIATVLTQGQDYTGSAEVLGEDYESAYRPIKDASGKVIGMVFVGLSIHEMDAIQNSFLIALVLTTVVIVIVMSGLAWLAVGRVMAPLQKVATAMHEIADGDMRGAELTVTEDEIGDLAHSANTMRDKLRRLLSDVSRSSDQVTEAAHRLQGKTNHTTESIQYTAESAVHLAEDTTKQATTINKLQESITHMRAQMHELHSRAKEMDEVAGQSRDKSKVGRATVAEAVAQIRGIADQVNASAKLVGTLGERSAEIGTFVETIAGIAEQTNLLALNAAIEAARAGEAGRGFAVVADEVRKLAEQSAEAAQKIAELVATIQRDTDIAIKSIAQGNESAKAGSASVEATGAAFQDIEAQVGQLADNMQRSIEYIELLNTSSHEIAGNMDVVMDFSRRSTDEAQNVSAATEEQAANMHEMADASEALASLATSLRDGVQRFKI